MNCSEVIGFIGTIASIIGLVYTIYAYKKIKQVKTILRLRAMNNAIISNIELIMKYPENIPLAHENKRNIENVIKSIESNLSEKKNRHKFEKGQIESLRTEINDSNPNIKNIKSIFKTLKAIVITFEEE